MLLCELFLGTSSSDTCCGSGNGLLLGADHCTGPAGVEITTCFGPVWFDSGGGGGGGGTKEFPGGSAGPIIRGGTLCLSLEY